MPLKQLSINSARNIKRLSLDFHPAYNIIYGSNGVGKTTILESIYLLLRTRTFRSNKFKNFINIHANECIIYSTFSNSDNIQDFTLGIKRDKLDKSPPLVHLNKKKITSLASITGLVVLGLITPDSFNLIDSSPAIRRKYLDWGVFHVEHKFLNIWKDYKCVLKNRNMLLKQQKKYLNRNMECFYREIQVWDQQLVSLNEQIHDYRLKQFNEILPLIFEILNYFSRQLAEDLSLTYYRGWTREQGYEVLLQSKLMDDISSGFTNYGTHRSDLKFLFCGKPARDILSRGQKKILIVALILAQFVYLIRSRDSSSFSNYHFILLLDDLDSELDDENLELFFSFLYQFKDIQYFVTSTNPERFSFIDKSKSKMFHVEHL